MLSYQHIYHAGNLADVHKHALLAWVIDYMIRKDKPLTYMESHAGRGLYDLGSEAALKTGEAASGIEMVEGRGWFEAGHPYARALAAVRSKNGARTYGGSPLIAGELLRDTDPIRLAELHPQEHAALVAAMAPYRAIVDKRDGLELVNSICPPDPRRGLLLIDPSYERKDEYQTMAEVLPKIARKWPVGVMILWYPILTSALHRPMVTALRRALPEGIVHEVGFPPAREGHRMMGSGLFVVNPPFGFDVEAARLSRLFAAL